MLRPLTHLLYRHKDPTRNWHADPSRVAVDMRCCTLAGVPLGGDYAGIQALGPSEDAKRAARGFFHWFSQGLYAMEEQGRLADFTVVLVSAEFHPFAGHVLLEGTPVTLSQTSTPEQVVALLGEPFGTSVKEAGYVILFYEFEQGEVQFAFNTERPALESIEFQFNPELSDRGACEWYGIAQPFPERFRRALSP